MKALKFIMTNFMDVPNFEDIDLQSDRITPLTQETIDVLMNSTQYYEKKYTHDIEHMCEVYPFDDPSF